MIDDRRMVGIDLGIASDHTVRVLDGHGSEVCRRRARPTVESLAAVEVAAMAGAGAGVRLEVVIEPTGPAWLPIAVFFTARGHRVFRVSSAKAADLRRFLSRLSFAVCWPVAAVMSGLAAGAGVEDERVLDALFGGSRLGPEGCGQFGLGVALVAGEVDPDGPAVG